jgi:quinol monooxygenase YgiN
MKDRRRYERISYQPLENKVDPGDYTFVEEWTRNSAIDVCFTTPHV